MPVRRPGSPRATWPNMFIFPRELRELIPDYGARALVVDEVDGAPESRAFPAYGPNQPRARLQFVVHETGELEGRVPVYLDLDTTTMRSLGQFLIDLANQADADEGTS